ncbi:MAG TPA: hypothetical protein VN922_20850 [Bacteroidia bacterium]|nr:hypothetical protein [Bacteroidia bacterium]
MQKIFLIVILFFLIGCSDSTSKLKDLQSEMNKLNTQNDSLKKLVAASKPGLGEIMLGLQVHHNKLWFAGREENWPLAQFEHDEILELITQAETVNTDRPEVKLFKVMIYAQLDSIQKAIKQKDVHEFSEKFNALTNSCNNCHKNTHFEFNRIQTPERPPYSNQDFSTDNN